MSCAAPWASLGHGGEQRREVGPVLKATQHEVSSSWLRAPQDSAPALVRRAYWKGAQAAWKAPARNTSLMASPPSGCRKPTQPKRRPASTSAGTSALASRSPARSHKSALASSSTSARRCSAARPDGPAAPLRPLRTLAQKPLARSALKDRAGG